ncbi:CDP-glycerol glycerophosphotransferase family protein [Amphibacillus cookii]|uniref:CDP-glycerol glycerophosphotransferase family protein n=1 Tax=Amphibacillus cookii TaxID=767787 RepID=UPI00195B0CF0|nr:CDP-glycerol glycerophosphotransferase family protein [Amphibacillus cookii]MBM7543076.1 CDP-glycerol glycerophosphotransferase (TagB/SpsB family) [Amphibacillus cookii]
MARELIISSYLFICHVLFMIFKLFPQKQKTTFLASFGDNIDYVRRACLELTNDQIIVLTSSSCRISFQNIKRQTVLPFEDYNIVHFIRAIYHLATSKVIFLDNYFGCLSVMRFKHNVKCVQLWHAAGAIKKFGLKDPSIKNRTKSAQKRFYNVYNRFDYVVVGSEKMSNIFKESFNLSNNSIVRTGIPRTDFFFDQEKITKTKVKLLKQYPIAKNKKIILYAPTFRNDDLIQASVQLDINRLSQELKDSHILILKLHPAVRKHCKFINNEFIIDASNAVNVNEWLTITDILITDYSSIPFEFSILKKPMIFYSYDLKAYQKERGFWEDYRQNVPGPIASNTSDIIRIIKENTFDLEKVRLFSEKWNEYSTGDSSQKIIQFIYNQ